MSYTQQEVIDRANRILSQPVTLRTGTVNEFFDMACGGNAGGIRYLYYSGKPDNFFRDVLVIINGGK
jgi:hypothetical protein